MQTMSPKRMTIEDLAGMIQREFIQLRKEMATKVELVEFRVEVNERFEQVDKRFEQVDQRFEDLEGKITFKYDTQFDRIRDDLRVVKTKLKMEG